MKSEFYKVNFDLKFYPEEVDVFKSMWENGIHLEDIANKLGRDIEEAFILALDLTVKGSIPERSGGVYGQ